VAAGDQVVDHGADRGDVVDVDPGLGQVGRGAAEHDGRDGRLGQEPDPGVVDPGAGEDEAVYPAVGDQLPEDVQLVVVLGEDQDVVAALGGRADQGLDEAEDEGVIGASCSAGMW
jgi:hypothetical protein